METRIIEAYDRSLFDSVVTHIPAFPYSFIASANEISVSNYHHQLIEQGFNQGIVFGSSINGKLAATAVLIRLGWDSEHFGYECYSAGNCYINNQLDKSQCEIATKNLFAAITKQAKSKGAKFIYTSIGSWNTSASFGLQENGFKYILTWLDGVVKSPDVAAYSFTEKEGHTVGLATENEIDTYSQMAAEHYFEGGRFFLDKNFDKKDVRSMYAKLVRSSFEKGDVVISYRINNEPVGLFVSKKIGGPASFDKKIAALRFLVVSPETRKKGISKDLFIHTLQYLGAQCDYITTGLEIHNLPSLNLHSRMNFKFHYTHNAFHWWDKEAN